MDGNQPSRAPHSPGRPLWRWFLVGGSVLLLFGMLFLPYISTRAADLLVNGWLPAQGVEDAYLPMVLRDAPMQSDTPTPTSTDTPTLTLVLTNTPTPTITQTPSPTRTGTQPTSTSTVTPTATGTLTAVTTLTVKVTPTEAKIGGSFTFTIEIVNSGSGPTTDATISDSFPSYIDITSVTTTKGTVQKSAHSFTVSIGPIIGGEKITIVAVVKVNNSASKTETLGNLVTLTYGTTTKTASVNYKVVVTGLPGTGELPLDWRERALAGSPRGSSGLLTVTLLGLLGGLLLLSGFLMRQGAATASRWMIGVGLLALFAALTAAFTILTRPAEPVLPDALLPVTATLSGQPGEASGPATHEPAYLYATPEAIPVVTLPSYPIPSPVVSITQVPGDSGPDTSPVVRIAIPALTLDTVVKYVPWDGLSWWIMGLREEVAWLGNTSWPGLGGNTGLAAHVTVRGLGDGPFRYIGDLPAGETVILYTEQNIYTYAVRSSEVVDESVLEVTYSTDNPQITLITCTDWSDEMGMYTMRLVVYADLMQVEPIVRSGSH